METHDGWGEPKRWVVRERERAARETRNTEQMR